MIKQTLLGLLLASIISALSLFLAHFHAFQSWGISAATLAIVIGMLFGNTLYPKIENSCSHGVHFAKSRLLMLGIILYGFNLTFQQIASVGIHAILSDAIMLISTFVLTWVLGHYVFKMDNETTILMGAGASICGVAAILATESAIKANSSKVAVAVTTVVIFGTVSMFWYPQMHQLAWWPISDEAYAIYIGSSVHEVAQVYVAGSQSGASIADIAVTTKMIRVMMLAPFLMILMWWLANRTKHGHSAVQRKLVIPWFACGFIAVAGFNSLNYLPKEWVTSIQQFDVVLLTSSMSALGLTTHIGVVKKAGIAPILLGAILLLWLIVAGGGLQVLLCNALRCNVL